MRILVAHASKHGATAEIAGTVADVLRAHGHVVDLREASDELGLDCYEAVVIGSAVYTGRWLAPARRLAERARTELAGHPVWLFSSGPIGDPPKPDEDPVDVAVSAVDAVEHRRFAGRLERARLGFVDRAVVAALRAPDGDFRDPEEIRGWAAEIAAALRRRATA